jgi:hypothetical protein
MRSISAANRRFWRYAGCCSRPLADRTRAAADVDFFVEAQDLVDGVEIQAAFVAVGQETAWARTDSEIDQQDHRNWKRVDIQVRSIRNHG